MKTLKKLWKIIWVSVAVFYALAILTPMFDWKAFASETNNIIIPKAKPFVNDDHSLIQFHIKQNEGLKFRVYLDTRGNLTVGYGHKVYKSDGYKVGDYVSMSQVRRWFSKDYNTALSCAKRYLNNDYRSNELIVITDMAFNLGCTTLYDFFRLRKHINNHDYVMATKAIRGSNYYKQVKNRANRNILLLNQ